MNAAERFAVRCDREARKRAERVATLYHVVPALLLVAFWVAVCVWLAS